LVLINPRRIYNYSKGPRTNRVVYKYIKNYSIPSFSETLRKSLELINIAIFIKEFTGLSIKSSEESNTESRLRNLKEVYIKKKRTTHFPLDNLLYKK
jgi:hypothetical protein